MRENPQVLFSREQIAARVKEVGAEIAANFSGREVCVVGLMKGCMVFMADLVREIPLDLTCHFLRVSSFTEAAAASVRTDIVYSTEIPYTGRDILLLEDIVDTGITLRFLLDHIQDHHPRSLKVCTLIDKPGARKVDAHPDWAVFSLKEPPAGFLVGYGLDWADRYRGLPYIGTIPRPQGAPEAGGTVPGGR